jgi:hypothetical protein
MVSPRPAPRAQAEVEQVLDVVLRHLAQRGAGQHRLDDPAHPRLAQLVGELVQVGDAAQDQVLLGLVDQRHVDGAGAIAPGRHLEAGLVGQRVDQPGLALGQLPDPLQGLGGERLAGLGGVLAEQGRTSAWLKSPRRRDLALMLNALPPVMAPPRSWSGCGSRADRARRRG